MAEKWKKLLKIGSDTYKLEPHKPQRKCGGRGNCLQVCFAGTENERLFVIDTKGFGYLLEFTLNEWTSTHLGIVGQSSFVAFNPNDKFELIVGLASSDIKIIRINNEALEDFCVLEGHELPPTWASFYKNYCLTSSRKEAIIWDIETCMKIHKLQLESHEGCIRKAALSSLGHVTALYKNDTIQSWRVNQFDVDSRVCFCDHGLKNVKDFVFTPNGRALIICGAKSKIVVFDTTSWRLLSTLSLQDNSSPIRRLTVVPLALDVGLGLVISILYDDGNVKFFDLSANSYLATSEGMLAGIRKLVISPLGQWIATIPFDGSLDITSFHRLTNPKPKTLKIAQEIARPKAHRADLHLKFIQRSMKDTLKLNKLLPILKEFGEYPERHRAVIWKTIMELPGNRKAFACLNSKIPVENTSSLAKKYNLADKSKANMLGLNVDRLSQLCPWLGHSEFLPELIFPFLVVFQKDPLAAFEAVITILSNYCQQWFEYHPFPPLNVLGIVENALMESDSSLLEFYCAHGITSTQYAWPLLRTTMSEVFSADEWLILWDHLLSHRKQSLFILCIVAYNICSRETVLSLLKRTDDVEMFFRRPGQVGVKDVLKVACRLDREISQKNHPSRYLRDTFSGLPSEGPYPPILFGDYPKFLVENPAQLKDEKPIFIEDCRHAAKVAEEKRLALETDRFIKKVQQQRLKAFQECYESQFRSRTASDRGTHQKLRICSQKCSRSAETVPKPFVKSKSGKSRMSSCAKLRRDVQQLEDEVETFMETIKSRR